MTQKNRKKRVSLVLWGDDKQAYSRELMLGVADFVGDGARGWVPTLTPDWKTAGDTAGVILCFDFGLVDWCVEHHVPVVGVLGPIDGRIPRVSVDVHATGRMAAEHLISRGAKRLAYFGHEGHQEDAGRREGFVEACTAAGLPVEVFASTRADRDAGTDEVLLRQWLASLQLPVGIMAFNDLLATLLLRAAETMDLRVPEDIAVVGVDNDELLCVLSDPQLSSVATGARRIGYRAAQMLDRMLADPNVAHASEMLPPLHVVSRASSDVLNTSDPAVRTAIQFIREHALEDISVKSVASHLRVSRRWLEMTFKRHLNRTPADEILRIRMQRMKELLRETDLSIAEVARKSGFGNSARLSTVMRRETGMTPRAFRDRSKSVTGG